MEVDSVSTKNAGSQISVNMPWWSPIDDGKTALSSFGKCQRYAVNNCSIIIVYISLQKKGGEFKFQFNINYLKLSVTFSKLRFNKHFFGTAVKTPVNGERFITANAHITTYNKKHLWQRVGGPLCRSFEAVTEEKQRILWRLLLVKLSLFQEIIK